MGGADPLRVVARRQAVDPGRVRADIADAGPGQRLERRQDRGPPRPAGPACWPARRASTGRSSRRSGRLGGRARSTVRGCGREPSRPPGPPSAGRSRRRSSRTAGPPLGGSRGPSSRRPARSSSGPAGRAGSPPVDRLRAGDGSPRSGGVAARPRRWAGRPRLAAARSSNATARFGRLDRVHAEAVEGDPDRADHGLDRGIGVGQADGHEGSIGEPGRGVHEQARRGPARSPSCRRGRGD